MTTSWRHLPRPMITGQVVRRRCAGDGQVTSHLEAGAGRDHPAIYGRRAMLEGDPRKRIAREAVRAARILAGRMGARYVLKEEWRGRLEDICETAGT